MALYEYGNGLLENQNGVLVDQDDGNCCCPSTDCPDCCTWRGTINIPGGTTATFGGDEEGDGAGNYGRFFSGIFPYCGNVGLLEDLEAPGELYSQNPGSGDPCDEQPAKMALLFWCSFDPNTEETPAFHVTRVIYVYHPTTGAIVVCVPQTDCSFRCEQSQLPYTQEICDGFSAEFP